MVAGTRGRAGQSRKRVGATSPRRREALKRFVSMVKRKGHKRVSTECEPSLFRLLHVDIFQARNLYIYIIIEVLCVRRAWCVH